MARDRNDFNTFGNTTGAVVFDTVDQRKNKMAVVIKRIFPSPQFRRSQYIGLHMDKEPVSYTHLTLPTNSLV